MNRSQNNREMCKPDQKTSTDPRLIAYYLPQFHTIPENDEWWGQGFTEWTNVKKAKVLFEGHKQPIRPSTLGYYNLLDQEIQCEQASLAATYGISGFCYWHYWFGNGRRLLEKPFQNVITSGKPNLPVCLCWANQSWTGVWHGSPNRVLMQQSYPGREDEERHFNELAPAFADPRYITVDGKALFLIYNPGGLPNPKAFMDHWRELSIRSGLPEFFFVAMTNRFEGNYLADFDAITHHGPGNFLEAQRKLGFARRIARRMLSGKLANLVAPHLLEALHLPVRYEYRDLVAHGVSDLPINSRFLPCVIPGWDNTPRARRRGTVITGSTPALYGQLLQKAYMYLAEAHSTTSIIFIKAWNEWAEGNYLEPEEEFALQYLEETSRVVLNHSNWKNS